MSSHAAIGEKNGVKLPDVVQLPAGLPMCVEPTLAENGRRPFAERYARFIGAVKDAPIDLAENHDHFLYAAPKRTL